MSKLNQLAQSKNRRPYTDDRPSEKSGLSLAQLFHDHAGYVYGIDRVRQDGSTLPPKRWEKDANSMLMEQKELHFGGRPLTLEDYRSAAAELFELGLDYAVKAWTEGRGWTYDPDRAVKRLFPSSSWIKGRYLNEWRPGLILWLIITQVKTPHLDGTRSINWTDTDNGPAELGEAVAHYLDADQSRPVPLEINARELRKARRIDDYFNAQEATADAEEPQPEREPEAQDHPTTVTELEAMIDDAVTEASQAVDQMDRIKAAQTLDELPQKLRSAVRAACHAKHLTEKTAHALLTQAGKARIKAIREMEVNR